MPSPAVALCSLAITLGALYLLHALVLRSHLHAPGDRLRVREATLPVGKASRSFLYAVPDTLRPGSPLLVVFHGGSGTPEQMRTYTGFGFEQLARDHGFALAYPRGVGGNWNTCQSGRKNAATRLDVDDVGLMRGLVAWFAEHHAIDPSRVFAAGFSNGGHMCLRLAVEMGEEVAGVAAIAANRPAPADCKCASATGRHVPPMMFINGTVDPINPYEGGELSPYGLRSLGPVLSSMETARSFAPPGAVYRKTPMPSMACEDGHTLIERHAWTSGTGIDDVVLLAVHGGGHTIPQPRCRLPRLFGRTSAAIDAPQEIWRFFNTACATSRLTVAPTTAQPSV